MAGRRGADMESFWGTLSSKIKSLLWVENRVLILSSDDVPLMLTHHGRLASLKTAPKFYLFNDAFCVLQGSSLTEHPLGVVWVEHVLPQEGMMHSIQNMTSFRLLFPESILEVMTKELSHKSKWVSSITDAIGVAINCPQFTIVRGDFSLDTKLELLKARDYSEYTFKSLSEFKDGKYKGQWLNTKPHGNGEYSHESTGVLYKGGFKEGKFHGNGDQTWFLEKDHRKKYIGEFRNGLMDGHGEMKYSNSDVYSGHWREGERCGFGRIEHISRKSSFYIGGWQGDKQHGYGVYEDKLKHWRYLGLWSEGTQNGPGVVVNYIGTYSEAVYTNGAIASGHDGLLIDPDGRSFVGKIGPELKLAGKGVLTLTNGTTVEGTFAGQWREKIEISKGVITDGERRDDRADSHITAMDDLQIAKLDGRVGMCTISASNKWESIFNECEMALGFSGDAANDVFLAWSKIATRSFQHRKIGPPVSPRPRRSSSLAGLHGRTVKVPVGLITLDRARARTLRQSLHHVGQNSLAVFPEVQENKPTAERDERKHLEISSPVNLEEPSPVTTPVPSQRFSTSFLPYSPSADVSRSPPRDRPCSAGEEETVRSSGSRESPRNSFDLKKTIQDYIDKSFSNRSHPLGLMMTRLEMVYLVSYGGLGTNRYLLSHAIAETHFIIKRIHSVVRILFPFMAESDASVSSMGFSRIHGDDPDDFVDIESGYALLHPLVFSRLFPTLINLYVLHHEAEDDKYKRGVDSLRAMATDKLVQFIGFPSNMCDRIIGQGADSTMLEGLDYSSNTLRTINTLFTPGEFLVHFKSALHHLNTLEQLSGDFLLPAIVFILIRADLPNLGSYLHFLTDFAYTSSEDDYTLVTYEAAYNFIKSNSPGSSRN